MCLKPVSLDENQFAILCSSIEQFIVLVKRPLAEENEDAQTETRRGQEEIETRAISRWKRHQNKKKYQSKIL
jgi:hypothetical protein